MVGIPPEARYTSTEISAPSLVSMIESSLELLHDRCSAVTNIEVGSGCSRLDSTASHVMVARDDGYVAIYDNSVEEVDVIAAHDDMVSSLSLDTVDDDPQFMCSCGWDEAVVLWDLHLLDQPLLTIESAHRGPVMDISFAPKDPHNFVSIGHDGFVRRWDSRCGDDAVSILNCGQRGSSLTFADDLTIVAGLIDGRICCYDARKCSGQIAEHNFEDPIRRVKRLHPLNDWIGVATNHGYTVLSFKLGQIVIHDRYSSETNFHIHP